MQLMTHAAEIKQHIRRLQIQVKRGLRAYGAGTSKNVMRGTGFLFDQLRDYYPGDDVRFIDWNSSARMNAILVKQYLDERYRPLVIALDISSSMQWATSSVSQWQLAQHIASALTLIGYYNNDPIGLLLFADQVYEFIHPTTGTVQLYKILNRILCAKPLPATSTRLSCLKDAIIKYRLSRHVLLIVSDFIDSSYMQTMSTCKINRRSQVHGFVVKSAEYLLPNVGFITVKDPESGITQIVDARSVRGILQQTVKKEYDNMMRGLKKGGFMMHELSARKPLIPQLIKTCIQIPK